MFRPAGRLTPGPLLVGNADASSPELLIRMPKARFPL